MKKKKQIITRKNPAGEEPEILAKARAAVGRVASMTPQEARQLHKDLDVFIKSSGRFHAAWVTVAKCCKLRLKQHIQRLEQRLQSFTAKNSTEPVVLDSETPKAEEQFFLADGESSEVYRSAA